MCEKDSEDNNPFELGELTKWPVSEPILVGDTDGKGCSLEQVKASFEDAENSTSQAILPRSRPPAVCFYPRAKARSSRFCHLAP
jgi:hypothetical protein